jgi:rRNA-processing protein FCF1
MASKIKPEEKDPYYKHNFFQDPSLVFSLKNKPLEEIKDNCVFVLDTNALFIPYETGQSSFQEISTLLKNLKHQNKLIIPSQVAREFALNRPNRLIGMIQKINDLKSKITSVGFLHYPILESNDEFQKAKEILNEISELQNEFKAQLSKISEVIKKWSWDDPVSNLYDELFTKENIIDCGLQQSEIIELQEFRYYHKIPPGYKDGSKDDNGVGDLIIWFTILKLAEEGNNVVFVSGETKPDWFHRTGNEGIYPRYELVYEFKEKSKSNNNFHIIKFSELIELFNVNTKTVNEVKSIEESTEINKTYSVSKNSSKYIDENVDRKITFFNTIRKAIIKNFSESKYFYRLESNEYLFGYYSINDQLTGQIIIDASSVRTISEVRVQILKALGECQLWPFHKIYVYLGIDFDIDMSEIIREVAILIANRSIFRDTNIHTCLLLENNELYIEEPL